MTAFAMKLPAKLGEQQLACLQQYGQENCEEFRVDTHDPIVTIFAGVLRHPFAHKKSAQTGASTAATRPPGDGTVSSPSRIT